MVPRRISNRNHQSKNNNYIYLGKIIIKQRRGRIIENSRREQQKQFYKFCYINYRASENLQHQLVSILAPINDGQNLIYKHNNLSILISNSFIPKFLTFSTSNLKRPNSIFLNLILKFSNN